MDKFTKKRIEDNENLKKFIEENIALEKAKEEKIKALEQKEKEKEARILKGEYQIDEEKFEREVKNFLAERTKNIKNNIELDKKDFEELFEKIVIPRRMEIEEKTEKEVKNFLAERTKNIIELDKKNFEELFEKIVIPRRMEIEEKTEDGEEIIRLPSLAEVETDFNNEFIRRYKANIFKTEKKFKEQQIKPSSELLESFAIIRNILSEKELKLIDEELKENISKSDIYQKHILNSFNRVKGIKILDLAKLATEHFFTIPKLKGFQKWKIRFLLKWDAFWGESKIRTATAVFHFLFLSGSFGYFGYWFFHAIWVDNYAKNIAVNYWDDYLLSPQILWIIFPWLGTVFIYYIFYYRYRCYKYLKTFSHYYWLLKYIRMFAAGFSKEYVIDSVFADVYKIKLGLIQQSGNVVWDKTNLENRIRIQAFILTIHDFLEFMREDMKEDIKVEFKKKETAIIEEFASRLAIIAQIIILSEKKEIKTEKDLTNLFEEIFNKIDFQDAISKTRHKFLITTFAKLKNASTILDKLKKENEEMEKEEKNEKEKNEKS